MVSANILCNKLLNVKNAVVIEHNFYSDQHGVKYLRIKARPYKWNQNKCPFCGANCPGYDHTSGAAG